jgi:aspartyl-tRNA(Asn)/glutamyl-tRNA(Gln) amidotransferase subunit C
VGRDRPRVHQSRVRRHERNGLTDWRSFNRGQVPVDLSREHVWIRGIPRPGHRGTTQVHFDRMVAFGMPGRLTRDDVDRIATLARLELSEREKEMFLDQLSHVLEYAEQIQRLDTTNIPPTSQVLAGASATRADDLRPGLPNDAALENAPDASDERGLFRVPRVLG